MPHKHKRKRNPHDSNDRNADFDLPPEKRARPLDARPAVKNYANDKEKFEGFGDAAAAEGGEDGRDNQRNKRRKPKAKDRRDDDKSKKAATTRLLRPKGGRADDDTPKQFARMMAWQARLKEKQKQKTTMSTQSTIETQAQPQPQPQSHPQSQPQSQSQPHPQHSIDNPTSKPNDHTPAADSEQPEQSLKIQKGESLSAFAQRVNRSLPLSGIPKSHPPPLPNNDKKMKKQADLQIPKDPLTRHNKHLQRMQSEWRNAETKLQARRTEADEDAADQREEDAMLWMDIVAARNSRKGKKKKKGGNEEDVWKALEKKRRQQHGGDAVPVPVTASVAGLTASQSVQAPPPQSTVRKLDVERVKRMFRGVE